MQRNPNAGRQPHAHRHDHKYIEERFVFSPNEIGFAGYSGAGKTTLVSALIEIMNPEHRIAYVKHDAHGFSMDREGKDTWRAAQSGASSVYISDSERFAMLGRGRIDEWSSRYLLNDVDIVLVEGFRRSELPKVVVVDRDAEILDEVARGDVANIIAYVVRDDAGKAGVRRVRETSGETPIFDSSETERIAGFLLDVLEQRARSIPLYGLVLGGGKSTRMKRDKAKISYRGVPQVRYAHDLLSRFCERVFVSIRADQAGDTVFQGLEVIQDRFIGIGPMGGMLSAMHTHPHAAWLVLGCDLPFVDEATLTELTRQRDPLLQATCYESAHDGLPEPLCAVYEPRYRRRLHQFLADGRDCPRKALINTRAKHLTLANPRALDNINSPDEYEEAVALIEKETHRVG